MRSAILGLFGLVLACGSRERPPEEKPTKEQVRDFYALNGNSCWRYRYSSGGSTLFLDMSVSEPNDVVVAGEVVYIVKFTRPAQPGQPDEWYLDAEENAAIRLKRSVTGVGADRDTSRYEDVAPLFAAFELDEMKQVTLELGARFETETTPLDKDANPKSLESHRWTVQANDEMVTTPMGDAQAFNLLYRKNDGTNEQLSEYSLVPGFGFARWKGADGTFYQVCNARVCDSTGACTGADDCASLQCP